MFHTYVSLLILTINRYYVYFSNQNLPTGLYKGKAV